MSGVGAWWKEPRAQGHGRVRRPAAFLLEPDGGHNPDGMFCTAIPPTTAFILRVFPGALLEDSVGNVPELAGSASIMSQQD